MRNNLRIYRAIENITQEELANELGVSRQTIVAIENDKYNPSLELAFKIAHKFDVKIEDIFISDMRKNKNR
ncbi:helix-turn-helix transcriptional regulator [Methanobrevibacter sp.]|uniref:helix-turn-helix transcriptional regulator n=1 Tax=Methanobrevibacter sp. TaxID=66852 RepID=UPI00388EBA9E